jgi:hypothetical protein
MRRILPGLAMTALFLGLLPSPAAAQADHLQCFKIRDTVAKTTFNADLTPSDPGFPVATGCIVRVPARLLCVDVVKSIVGTQPPGAPAGAPTHKFLCYKVKCPKATPATTVVDQFGNHQVTVKSTSLLCAPVPVPTTTTTTLPCVPTPEVCNGVDDNCNGMIDDGLGQTTCGVGACQNTVQNCVMGMPQSCTPGMPTAEICGNAIDDDCDGTVDEQPCTCTFAGQCPGAPNANAACVSGMCTITCNMGFANCNMNNADGCEVNTQNNVSNCGSCGLTCPTQANSTPTCNASVCGISCTSPFLNCDGMNANGCEVNPTSDPVNCGSCGVVCPMAAPNCVSSACTP